MKRNKDSYEPIFIRGTAVGVVLCILAVIPTIIAGAMETSDYCCGLSMYFLKQPAQEEKLPYRLLFQSGR